MKNGGKMNLTNPPPQQFIEILYLDVSPEPRILEAKSSKRLTETTTQDRTPGCKA